jgi:hypothetical protein
MEITDAFAGSLGVATQASRTWMLLFEATEGGWGIVDTTLGQQEFADLAAKAAAQGRVIQQVVDSFWHLAGPLNRQIPAAHASPHIRNGLGPFLSCLVKTKPFELGGSCRVMVEFGLTDLLTLAQTVGIIGTMIMTLYFSKRQIQGITVDVETRVLNDLDEKRFRISELMIENPEMISVAAGPTSGTKPEHVIAYMVAMVCAHAFHMRERKIISDNEWIGWLQWMKNDFAQGTIRRDWIDLKMGQWFDPRFRDFIDKEIIAST